MCNLITFKGWIELGGNKISQYLGSNHSSSRTRRNLRPKKRFGNHTKARPGHDSGTARSQQKDRGADDVQGKCLYSIWFTCFLSEFSL